MKIGIALPNNWGVANVHDIVDLARRADTLGFDSVWVQDHLFNCGYVKERIADRPYYHPLALLSHLSACTERVALGTSVMVLPYHDPVALAKYTATLDHLSRGRVILGVGVGVMEEEFAALGVPIRERGKLTDESIAVMQALWTSQSVTHQGRRWQFENMTFSPKCLQRPHVPLWVGGSSRAALARTARIGAGWQPVGLSPSDYAAARDQLSELAEAGGRKAAEITLSVRLDVDVDPKAQARNATLGRTSVPADDPARIRAILEGYAEVGVTQALLAPATADIPVLQALYERIASELIT